MSTITIFNFFDRRVPAWPGYPSTCVPFECIKRVMVTVSRFIPSTGRFCAGAMVRPGSLTKVDPSQQGSTSREIRITENLIGLCEIRDNMKIDQDDTYKNCVL